MLLILVDHFLLLLLWVIPSLVALHLQSSPLLSQNTRALLSKYFVRPMEFLMTLKTVCTMNI
jgi:hypothetical protein